MHLAWLELQEFRTYESMRWVPNPGVNVLVGPNAVGKTNILEAVAYLAALKSFRGVPDAVLVNTGAPGAVVRGEIGREGSDVLIEIELPVEGRRRAQVNRQRLSKVGDLLGHIRTVAFLPDDLDVVKRGPGYRRDLIDAVAVQIWPGAHRDQQEYDKVLRQRNSLLRQMGRDVDSVTLAVWDERLSEAGARVMARRHAALANITGGTNAMYQQLSSSETIVSIDYRSHWGAERATTAQEWERNLAEALSDARRADMDRRVTTVGPHRDDPVILLDDQDSRTHASQGEQRTVTLALRLSAHQAIAEQIGESPILLLDDVFSELDPLRAAALAEALPDAQTLITTARDDEVPIGGRRWSVEFGRVT